MKKRNLLMTLILGIVCLTTGLATVFISPNKREVSAATISVDSYFMYKDATEGSGDGLASTKILENDMIKDLNGNSIIPGKTSGYSTTIPMGTTDVTLTAAANNGYVLKGWIVIENPKEVDETIFYFPIKDVKTETVYNAGTNSYDIVEIADGEEDALNFSYKISKFDVSYPNKRASFGISLAGKDLIVEPVFDYEYYNITIKYKGGETIYTTADYSETYKTGDVLYLNNIELSNLVVANKFEGVSLTATSSEISEDTLNQYKFNNVNGKTEKFSLNYLVSGFKDVVIELNYTQLYQLDFKFMFDGVELSSGDAKYSNITSCLSNNAEFYRDLGNYSYYVKDNARTKFYVKDFGRYYDLVNYDFGTSTGQTNLTIDCDTLINSATQKSGSITVKLNYTDFKYTITYGTVLLRGTNQYSSINLNQPSCTKVQFVRGDGISLVGGDGISLVGDVTLGNNYGYEFVGWAMKDIYQEYYAYTDSEVKIDTNSPANIVVYAVYKEKEYIYQFGGLTTYSLVNGSTTYYPISELVVNGNKLSLNNESEYLETVVVRNNGQYLKYTIGGQALTIKKPVLNNGFKFLGFGLIPQTETGAKVVYSYSDTESVKAIELNDKLIEKAKVIEIDSEEKNVITLYPYFEYVTYSINYSVNDNTFARISVITTGTNATTSGTSVITISNLKLYDKITLKSSAEIYDGEEYYQCYLFNVDGKSQKANNGKYEYVVTDNVNIQVVYGVPKTILTINVVGLQSEITYSVYEIDAQGNESLKEKVNGETYYEVHSGDMVVKLNWNVETYFGYEHDSANTKLEFNGPTGTVTKHADNYDFSFSIGTSKTDYALTIAFKPIVYNYIFTLKSDTTVTKTGTFSAVSPIRFDKAEGYYVTNVTTDSDRVITAMNQENSSKDRIVSFRGEDIDLFSTYIVEFDTIKNVLISNNVTTDIEFTFDYVLYKYNVKINYLVYKGAEKVASLGNTPPGFVLQGNSFAGTFTGVSKIVANELAIIYENVPYGFSGTISAGTMAHGYKQIGFCDNMGIGSLVTYDFSSNMLTEDMNLFYRIDFVPYMLTFTSETNGVQVIEGKDKKVPMYIYDELTNWNLNVPVETGYKFDYIAYEYNYDVDTWESMKSTLYRKNDEGEYVENGEADYIAGKAYYIIKKLDKGIFNISQFDVDDYVVKYGDIVEFYVKYAPIEMVLTNVALFDADGDANQKILSNMKMLFGLVSNEEIAEFINNNIANFTVSAKRGTDTARSIEFGDIVTVEDTITITIRINDDYIFNGYSYEISNGISLNLAYYYNLVNTPSFVNNNDGSYSLKFDVKDCRTLNTFVENGEIVVSHKFGTNGTTNSISVTTNLNSINEFNKNIQLEIDVLGNNGFAYNKGGSSDANYEGYFLAGVRTYLRLNKGWNGDNETTSKYNEYFTISLANVRVFVNGKKINLNYYTIGGKEVYGNQQYIIIIDKDENGLVYLETYLTQQKVEVVYDVQPILYFEGNKFDAGVNNAYTFGLNQNVHYYSYDAGANLPLNMANLNDGIDVKKYDIVGFNILNYYNIEYTNKDGNPFIAHENNCIPAGEYTVKLVKKTNIANPYPEITANLSLKVLKMPLTLTGKLVGNVIQQEYNGDYDYKQFTIKTSGEGIILTAEDVNGKDFAITKYSFNENCFAYISKTLAEVPEGEEIDWLDKENLQIKWKDAASGLNVYIQNLSLDSDLSNNYELVNSYVLVKESITITPKPLELSSLSYSVNDKVFNGDSETTLTYINKIKVNGIVEGDDVELISENVKAFFENEKIGGNKTIFINAHDALEGKDKNNYYIGSLNNDKKYGEYSFEYKYGKGTIYPDEITSTDGSIKLRNVRGLTDLNMIALIPLDATLCVNKIEKETEKYVEIYPNIANFISRRNVFQVGYELVLKDKNGEIIPINSNLHLVVVSVDDVNDVISITDDGTFNLEHTAEGDGLLIDLSQLETRKITHIVLTEESQLLKTWQIVLIVSLAVALIGGGVTAALIIRKKKKGSYGKYDKI